MMRIDDQFSPSNDLRSQSVGHAPETAAPARPQDRKAEAGADSASLSSLGLELARAIDQDPPEEVARIARLQQAVANGTYSVPSSAISAKIVSSALKADL